VEGDGPIELEARGQLLELIPAVTGPRDLEAKVGAATAGKGESAKGQPYPFIMLQSANIQEGGCGGAATSRGRGEVSAVHTWMDYPNTIPGNSASHEVVSCALTDRMESRAPVGPRQRPLGGPDRCGDRP
jgi:hypothetical protein